MKLERRELVEAVRYYEIDITERDLKEFNDEIIKANPDFIPLTFEDIRNYIRFDMMWDKGREKLVDGYYSIEGKPYSVDLYDYLTEWLNERFWENETDLDVRELYDVQLRELEGE